MEICTWTREPYYCSTCFGDIANWCAYAQVHFRSFSLISTNHIGSSSGLGSCHPAITVWIFLTGSDYGSEFSKFPQSWSSNSIWIILFSSSLSFAFPTFPLCSSSPERIGSIWKIPSYSIAPCASGSRSGSLVDLLPSMRRRSREMMERGLAVPVHISQMSFDPWELNFRRWSVWITWKKEARGIYICISHSTLSSAIIYGMEVYLILGLRGHL